MRSRAGHITQSQRSSNARRVKTSPTKARTAKPNVYMVFAGLVPGIYNTW
jgi:hypothetical protein